MHSTWTSKLKCKEIKHVLCSCALVQPAYLPLMVHRWVLVNLLVVVLQNCNFYLNALGRMALRTDCRKPHLVTSTASSRIRSLQKTRLGHPIAEYRRKARVSSSDRGETKRVHSGGYGRDYEQPAITAPTNHDGCCGYCFRPPGHPPACASVMT